MALLMRLIGPRPATERASFERHLTELRELHDRHPCTAVQKEWLDDGSGEFVVLLVSKSDQLRDVLKVFRVVLYSWWNLRAEKRVTTHDSRRGRQVSTA